MNEVNWLSIIISIVAVFISGWTVGYSMGADMVRKHRRKK